MFRLVASSSARDNNTWDVVAAGCGVKARDLASGVLDIHGRPISHFYFEQLGGFYQVTDLPVAVVN